MHILEGVLGWEVPLHAGPLAHCFHPAPPTLLLHSFSLPPFLTKTGCAVLSPRSVSSVIYFHSFVHLLGIYSSSCAVQARSSQTNSACPRPHTSFLVLGKERFGLESIHFLFGLEPTLELEEDFPSLNPARGRKPLRGKTPRPRAGRQIVPCSKPRRLGLLCLVTTAGCDHTLSSVGPPPSVLVKLHTGSPTLPGSAVLCSFPGRKGRCPGVSGQSPLTPVSSSTLSHMQRPRLSPPSRPSS